MVKRDELYEPEYNCLTSDLVGGFLASTDYPEDSVLYVYNNSTNKLAQVHKLHSASGNKKWFVVYPL